MNKSHINRIIKDNNITLKITRIRHEPVKRFGKDIDINANIKKFYEEIKKYKIEDIICIDETSIKSLQKLDGLNHIKLKENIENVISKIPKEKYRNIFKGAYERPEKYIPKNKTRKIKNN